MLMNNTGIKHSEIDRPEPERATQGGETVNVDVVTSQCGPRAYGARHPVLGFFARRMFAGVLTLLVASVLIFLATNALPGDVARAVLGRNATPELVQHLRQELDLNRPLHERYASWLVGVVQGDLGHSAVAIAQGNSETSIAALVGAPFGNSIVLALITMALLIPTALVLGTFMAVRAGRAADYAVSYPLLVIGSLPEFVFGTLLIALFFTVLKLLPPVSLIMAGESPLAHPAQLVLPVLTLLGVLLAFCARQVRAGVRAALQEEYVTMARLSGLRERLVIRRYALRNAIAPSVQTFAQSFQYLFGGIIVVELLFAYPGIGQVLVQAVINRDIPLVQSITLVLAAVFISLNIIADLLVVFLVPKLRTGLK
jgi:peptide/nickel transport system permease protein